MFHNNKCYGEKESWKRSQDVLHWVVKEGLREKVILGQNPEGGKRISHVNTCRLRIPG